MWKLFFYFMKNSFLSVDAAPFNERTNSGANGGLRCQWTVTCAIPHPDVLPSWIELSKQLARPRPLCVLPPALPPSSVNCVRDLSFGGAGEPGEPVGIQSHPLDHFE